MVEEEDKIEEIGELSRVDELLILWNEFARALIDLKESWENFRELYLETSPGEIEASIGLSKYASMYGRVKFELVLSEIVGHCQAYDGDLEKLIIDDLEKEE